ncbi:MAG: tRNA (adenosine(37)-N6)-threonylcarbamoyltransferase complex dimerization subunit type 1 TsaB [Desulfovibrio sp.]|jgi:tRNA threonylcarbamoyl adenosine modification protein YeaZ|nr:tRNA (adenosine(37)-N6)-threonylcarbamoyltransferase complex dimerization subunit type 1 TsaB [Desulfovibrio sp.]
MAKAYSTGLELVLNASEGLLQIVVTDDETPRCAQEWNSPQRGAELLTPALAEICAALRITMRDFCRVACVRGPGSFTGIRLVLTASAALRRAGRARLAGLDYLQALAATAAMHRNLLYGTRIVVLTHARRNLVHCRSFVSLGPVIPPMPVDAARLAGPQEVLSRLKTESETELKTGRSDATYVCGSGLARNAAVFEGAGLVLMPECRAPSVSALRLLARHGDYFDRDIEPLYLRPCDAVENLPLLAERQGLPGDEVAARLEDLLNRPPASRG